MSAPFPIAADPNSFSQQPSGDPKVLRWRLAWIDVCILAAVIYIPALAGPMIWDDHELLTGAGIGHAQSIWDCFTRPFLFHYYRPLTSISFLIEHRLWGETTFWYHLTNLSLHVFTVGALIGLLLAAFRSRKTALIGGLLFAVQPVQISTTAWIGGRTDALCTLFLVIYGWFLISAARRTDPGRWKPLVASALAFGAALLAKEQALTAILLTPLAMQCFGARDDDRKFTTVLKASIPIAFVVVLFLGSWAAWGPKPPHPAPIVSTAYAATIGQSILYYALLLFAPTSRWLHTVSLGSLEAGGTVGFVIAAGAAACLFLIWRRSKEAAWFLAFAILSIVPAINLVPLASLPIAPYRAGLAGVGIAAVVGWLLAKQCGLLGGYRPRFALLWRAAGVAYVFWLTGLTAWGVLPWRNEIEISRLAMRYNPDCLFARLELASSLLDSGQVDEAESLLHRTVRVSTNGSTTAAGPQVTGGPEPVMTQAGLGDNSGWISKLYTRVGLERLKDARRDEANGALRTALALNPNDAFANVGMANFAYQTGDWRGAVEYLRIALDSAPEMTEKHMARGQILFQHAQWTDAQAEFAICVAQLPKLAVPYVALADAQKKGGDEAAARATLDLAVSRGVISAQEATDRLALRNP